MAVLDASFVTDALVVGGAHGTAVQRRLAEVRQAHAPHVLGVEVVSALRGLHHGGQVSHAVSMAALDRLAALRVALHTFAPFQARIWELRANATPYDAWYLAVAEAVGEPLLTTDRKLAAVPGVRCAVEVVRAT